MDVMADDGREQNRVNIHDAKPWDENKTEAHSRKNMVRSAVNNIEDNAAVSDACRDFCREIRKYQKKVVSVDSSSCPNGAIDITALANALLARSSVQVLRIATESDFEVTALHALSLYVSTSPNLRKVELCKRGSTRAFLWHIGKNKSIESCVIEDAHVCIAFLTSIISSGCLKHLSLRNIGNKSKDQRKHMALLLRSMQESRSLQSIDISNGLCFQRRKLVNALEQFLGHNTHLQTLTVNRWRMSGWQPLARGLAVNTTLLQLTFSSCSIQIDAMRSLINDGLRLNTSLKRLEFEGCIMESGFFRLLFPYLQTNTSLVSFKLETYHFVDPQKWTFFVQALAANTTLQELAFFAHFPSDNGDAYLTELACVLPRLRNLKKLKIRDVWPYPNTRFASKKATSRVLEQLVMNTSLVKFAFQQHLTLGNQRKLKRIERRNNVDTLCRIGQHQALTMWPAFLQCMLRHAETDNVDFPFYDNEDEDEYFDVECDNNGKMCRLYEEDVHFCPAAGMMQALFRQRLRDNDGLTVVFRLLKSRPEGIMLLSSCEHEN